MTLSTAFNIISSAFAANASQTAVVSRNIANANTPGYSREQVNLSDSVYGGVDVGSVTRIASGALQTQALSAASEGASQQAIADGLAKLAQTVDDSASTTGTASAQNGNSPAAMLGSLQAALSSYASSPSSPAAGQAAVAAASNLAGSLNSASATVQQVRQDADAAMATSVGSINSLLGQFANADQAVVSGIGSGGDVATAQDTRDSILGQLSQQIGVTTSTNPDGSLSLFTDSGVALYQGGAARQLQFSPSATLPAGAVGNPVMVNGIPVTGAGAPMAIQSGALAGQAQLRDVIAPQYSAQLDQIAGGLIGAFAETDQSASPVGAPLPGLFTNNGATSVPSPANTTGLAAAIKVSASVDPSQGGDVSLLRDGGISGNSNYVYNSTGAAGYSGRLQQLDAQIAAPMTFDPKAGLGSSGSLIDFATSSVGWVQGQNQQANSQASYLSALSTQASAALGNATGVSMDAEMTNMLDLENSYTTTAKLLTTVNTMFSALLNAA